MISNRCARKSLVTNCNSIISKNCLRFLVDSNVQKYKKNNFSYTSSTIITALLAILAFLLLHFLYIIDYLLYNYYDSFKLRMKSDSFHPESFLS